MDPVAPPMPAAPPLPPPPGAPREPLTFGMRPIAIGGLCLLVAAAASFLAFRRLWPYPPRFAATFLATLTALIACAGLIAARHADDERRRRLVIAAVTGAALVPFVATVSVPGVAQPRSATIPGGPPYVVSAAPDGTWELYFLPVGDPDELIALTDTVNLQERWPQLSPDGSMLAYSIQASDGTADLRLMRLGPDGAVLDDDLLVPSAGRRLASTTWTPDGALLVQVDTERTQAAVERLDVDTGELSPFLPLAGNVAYSPDGQRIAYTRPKASDPSDWDIWIADADGGNERDVIDAPGGQEFPAWSPDGSKLLFTAWPHDDADVLVANADGSVVTDLTADSRDKDTSVGWTPDGHILFLSDRSHTGGTFLYFMNADGSEVRLSLRL